MTFERGHRSNKKKAKTNEKRRKKNKEKKEKKRKGKERALKRGLFKRRGNMFENPLKKVKV